MPKDVLHTGLPSDRVTTLFVSPSDTDQASLKSILASSNWSLQAAGSWAAAVSQLRNAPIAVVICDGDFPGVDWRGALEYVNNMQSAPKVIVCSRKVNDHLWGEVWQRGAYDLLEIPWDSRAVFQVVAGAWRSWDFTRRVASPVSRATAVGASAA
jgi:DNA-binding NtrC family response regulator